MSGHVHYIAGDLPYYVIDCDLCTMPFARYDDSCYDWQTLRAAAVEAGWDLGSVRTDPASCPSCRGRAATRTAESDHGAGDRTTDRTAEAV
jgi:hypothetical protein